MSHSNSQSETFELLVRDAKGEYRLATGDEVLKAARQVIGRRRRELRLPVLECLCMSVLSKREASA